MHDGYSLHNRCSMYEGNDLHDGNTVLVIVGPTASGKTALSVEAALAFGGEVISADSMQIYRRMDIGTAKPTVAERRGIPHHLMDMVNPDQPFSVADWQTAAVTAIREIAGRGQLPIVAGGTGLYVNSLIHNLNFSEVTADPAYRAALQLMAETEGVLAVHAQLASCDPESAGRIHPNNLVRVIRTLEVVHATGEPMSVHHERSRTIPSPWHFILFGLLSDRPVLYERIDRRVEHMLEAGLAEEVRNLLQDGYGMELQAMQGIGYKELAAHFAGQCKMEEAVLRIQQGSRNYAKRQITWFSRLAGLRWMDPATRDMAGLLHELAKALESSPDIE